MYTGYFLPLWILYFSRHAQMQSLDEVVTELAPQEAWAAGERLSGWPEWASTNSWKFGP